MARVILPTVLALAALLLACGGDDSPTPTAIPTEAPQPGSHRPGYLLAGHRTHLSICVDALADVGVTADQRDRVSAALDDALAGLAEVPDEFGEPSVVSGCPEPELDITGQPLGYDDIETWGKWVRAPSLLSPHRVFVYFVPADLYSSSFGEWFGERRYARISAEYICEGDACTERTVSVYVPDSVQTADLAQGLLDALALYRPPPQPTIDWSVCEQGTPAPWCDRYEDYKEWRETQEAGSGAGN